jgi:hypothetical protein
MLSRWLSTCTRTWKTEVRRDRATRPRVPQARPLSGTSVLTDLWPVLVSRF